MQPEHVQQLIELGLKDADVYVEGDGAHFTALIVSSQFAGKSRVQRQQLVNDTVRKQLLDGSLHALSMKTLTPEEWQKIEDSEKGAS